MRSGSALKTPPLKRTAVGWTKDGAFEFDGKVAGVGESGCLASEERAQVPGDRGVLCIGQSHLRETGAAGGAGRI